MSPFANICETWVIAVPQLLRLETIALKRHLPQRVFIAGV
jgi:hypothetical protein